MIRCRKGEFNAVTKTNNRAFIISHLIIPLLIMAPILIAFEFTNWDVAFQHLFYIAETGNWIVGKRGLAEAYLHDGAKWFTWVYGVLCIVGLVLSYYWERFKEFRRDFLFLILAVVLATSVVTSLKQVTNVLCPTQTTIFDGDYTYVKVFEPRIEGQKRGICWPGGHASAGFAFLSAYFVVRRRWPRYAVPALVGGVGMGVLYGSVRMMQGLHFLSHMLWSGIICWEIMVVLSIRIFKDPSKPATVQSRE
jgi:membrane-associated PAP2 superfamily phosphatase